MFWIDLVRDWPDTKVAWLKAKPEVNLGPYYYPSAGMCWSWERFNIKLLNGYFSVAVHDGHVLSLATGPDQTAVTLSADEWPVCRGFELSAPFGYFAAAFGLLPLLALTRSTRQHRLTRQRRRLGLCPACGYDLRATTGRCPECGCPVKSKKHSQ